MKQFRPEFSLFPESQGPVEPVGLTRLIGTDVADAVGERIALSNVGLIHRGHQMVIKEHMEVIGADGVHVGTVDKVEGGRIKLTKTDSGEGAHKGHHHFIKRSLVADVEGNKVRLSANANVAITMEQEESARPV